jgi:hypothetical protein
MSVLTATNRFIFFPPFSIGLLTASGAPRRQADWLRAYLRGERVFLPKYFRSMRFHGVPGVEYTQIQVVYLY